MSISDFPSETYTVKFEKLLSNGCCLAHADGMAVFVPYAIPGETAEIRITEQKKGYLLGKIIGISDYDDSVRIQPKCPVFTRCGGCALQHIQYERQLELKKNMLLETLSRTGHLSKMPEVRVFPSEPYGYRARVQLHPTADSRPGFMSGATNTVLPIAECPICNAAINSVLKNEKLRLHERTTFYSPDNRTVHTGAADFTFTLRDRELTASAQCFFQSNPVMYQKVLEELLMNVESGNTYLDLYSGIGLPGIFMADRFQELYFVEENPVSSRYGIKNIRDLHNCRFFNMKSEAWIKSPRSHISFDTVFVDPPRTGLSESVCSYLIKKQPENIYYLSCNFTTLARDLGKMTESGGYKIEFLDMFDFYPQTADMECLVKLKKGN